MFAPLFHNLREEDKNAAIESIIQHASPRPDFFLMLTLAIAMAVFGVLLGSTVILIGSMLIAPLLYPLLSLSLGIIAADEKLIGRSLLTIAQSIGLGLGAGFIIGLLFGGASVSNVSTFGLTAGETPAFMYAIVAAIAGFTAAFAITKPHLNETLPGVAIAVALVPPLAVAGVGLAFFDASMVSNALLLFVVNVIGIMFSAMIVFAMLRFSIKKKVTQRASKEEEKEIQEEAEFAKKDVTTTD